ncbi:MAG: hypothetical protein DWG76_00555 [Chloroflexi bacterium]|nr:hypothetical protein [Chloroflexota bacterium]MQC25928.1 hypothetical protein [Chloroflexota bacterium]
MSEKAYEIGRLLRAGISGFVAGTRVLVQDAPRFGALVRAPLGEADSIYGIIHEINIDDDGLVRQLVTTEGVDASVIADQRVNRNVPMEMSVLAVGYRRADQPPRHLLPPRAPLSLDLIYQCDDEEIVTFTNVGRFGYLRHLLHNPDLPVSELIAAHIQQADAAHRAAGDPTWARRAAEELILLLRDDYPVLMQVLGALSDAIPEFEVAP